MAIIDLSDSGFEPEVIRSALPVLVEFWAPGCGPCRAMAPLLESASERYEGRMTVARLNVDDFMETPGRYGVVEIPTMLLFRDGKVYSVLVGAVSDATLESWLQDGLES